VNDEPVQVLTAPPERRLQDHVQLGDRGAGGDQQSLVSVPLRVS
jgi:hypothetical protein